MKNEPRLLCEMRWIIERTELDKYGVLKRNVNRLYMGFLHKQRDERTKEHEQVENCECSFMSHINMIYC